VTSAPCWSSFHTSSSNGKPRSRATLLSRMGHIGRSGCPNATCREWILAAGPKTDARVVRVLRTPRDPANIPHDIENRGVATGINQEPNPQISGRFRPPPEVADSARGTLSRWRHGFKSRWDYEQRRRSDHSSSLDAESARGFVPHSSRGRPRHVTNCRGCEIRVVDIPAYRIDLPGSPGLPPAAPTSHATYD
jgi:hypothetical protein